MIKSFDDIIERPFIESILIAFFFTKDNELQNDIMNLLKTCFISI